MNADISALRSLLLKLLGPRIQGRTVILTGSAVTGRRMATFMRDVGAARVVPVSIEGIPAATQQRFAAFEEALARPGEKFARQIQHADPNGDGLVYAGSFTAIASVLGRKVIGRRSPEHANAERKSVQFELLSSNGYLTRLKSGLPSSATNVVVQGIPDESIAMSASHTYLLPNTADSSRSEYVAAQLERDCRTAIIRPFDTGVPCTFYGFVTPKWITDFGSVEPLVYWQPESLRIRVVGVMRPSPVAPDFLEAARLPAHEIARRLFEATGYVGAFGTDGVIHDGRYLIHEINPRVCAGFSLFDDIFPAIAPLSAIDLALRECGADAVDALSEVVQLFSEMAPHNSSTRVNVWDQDRSFSGEIAAQIDRMHDPATWARMVREGLRTPDLVHIADLGETL